MPPFIVNIFVEIEKSKSQKRADRQRRRQERREARRKPTETTTETSVGTPMETVLIEKKKKSLPGFLAKHRHELKEWLRHYMTLICKSDDFGVPYVRDMTRDQRNNLVQEYVDVAEFLTALGEYLAEETAKPAT